MTGDYQNELGELTIPGTLAKLKNYFALVGKYVLILGSSPHPLFRHSQRDAGDEKDTGKSYHGIAEYDSVTGQINGQLGLRCQFGGELCILIEPEHGH